MLILIKLILVHFIGDFFLQPDSWVKAKVEKKLRAYQLYIHSIVHGILTWLIVWEIQFFKWAILITIIHFIIDALKIHFQSPKNKTAFFFGDQILHLLSLWMIWLFYTDPQILSLIIINERAWLLITSVLFLTIPVSTGIKIFISRWTPVSTKQNESLQDAGKYIGILERLLVFVFVITNHWEGVGFLIATKSVFRFGDLKESKEVKMTEYILIGTLVSFGISIIVGIIYQNLFM